MASRVVVAGVGLIPFTKPYQVVEAQAARRAPKVAASDISAVQQVYADYVYDGAPTVSVNDCPGGSLTVTNRSAGPLSKGIRQVPLAWRDATG